MHASMFLPLLAATSALASPLSLSKRQSSASDIAASIQQWANDVNVVNGFLDGIRNDPTLDTFDVVDNGMAALQAANDEPIQLNTLCGLGGQLSFDAQFGDCVTLGNVFGAIPTAIQAILDAPTDVSTVAQQVELINNLRCQVVLPDIQDLWNAAADADDVSSSTINFPLQCAGPI